MLVYMNSKYTLLNDSIVAKNWFTSAVEVSTKGVSTYIICYCLSYFLVNMFLDIIANKRRFSSFKCNVTLYISKFFQLWFHNL